MMDENGLISVDGMAAEGLGGIAAKAEAQKVEPPPDMTIKGDGTVSLSNLGPLAAARLQKYIQLGAQTENFIQQAIQQAMKKKEVLEKNPLIAMIGRTTSAVASQYAAPGSRGQAIVRGLGAFGADFFEDTPESLIQRAAGLSGKQMEVEGDVLNKLQTEQRARLAQTMEDRRADTEDRIASQGQQRINLEARDQKRKAQNDVYGIFEQAARINRADTSDAFKTEAKSSGLFTDAEIEAKAKSLKALGGASAAAWNREKNHTLKMHLTEIHARRIEAAKDRAASASNARASAQLARVDASNKAIMQAKEDVQAGYSYFAGLADEVGLPPPTTQKEAQAVLNKAKKDPAFMDRKRSLDELGPRRLAQMNEGGIRALEQSHEMLLKAVPEEFRPDESDPTPAEVAPAAADAPPSALELEVVAMRDRGQVSPERARVMMEALAGGVIPDELRPDDRVDEGPIRTFEKAFEKLFDSKPKTKTQPVMRRLRR